MEEVFNPLKNKEEMVKALRQLAFLVDKERALITKLSCTDEELNGVRTIIFKIEGQQLIEINTGVDILLKKVK